MAATPGYAAIPRVHDVQPLSVANTNRDGTGALVTLSTGSAAGDAIEQVIIQATGNTTAGVVRFFLTTNGGSTKNLIDEVSIAGVTPNGTTQAFRTIASDLTGLILTSSQEILYASTNNAETFNVIVQKAGL